MEKTMDKIVALAKARGFVYPVSYTHLDVYKRQVLEYALLNAPGAPLKKALIDAGIGKDIMGSYDNGIYQPIFSIIAKNANEEQKEEFLAIIRSVLEDCVKNGISKKSLLAGINSMEFKFREADFGAYPKGLMYGLQCLDSWIYDEKEPFMHCLLYTSRCV